MTHRFETPVSACVFGASGGIGGALATALAARDDICAVHVGGRSMPGIHHEKFRPFVFDLTDEASIEAAVADMADDMPRWIIVATGQLHGEGLKPEKSLREQQPDAYAHAFAVNATGPALIAKHMLARPRRDGRLLFTALSARVGSIGDNRLGGWYAYRASKAALNMIMRCVAIEVARINPDAIAVTLHPGTVDTGLSQPFQRHVAARSLFTPDHSAERLLDVMDRLQPADSGQCFAWDGSPIPF